MSQAATLIRHQKTFRKFKHLEISTKDCIQKKSLKHVQKTAAFLHFVSKNVATWAFCNFQMCGPCEIILTIKSKWKIVDQICISFRPHLSSSSAQDSANPEIATVHLNVVRWFAIMPKTHNIHSFSFRDRFYFISTTIATVCTRQHQWSEHNLLYQTGLRMYGTV